MTLTPAAIPALRYFRDVLASMNFPLELEGAAAHQNTKLRTVTQFDHYLLPRLESLEAPLLAVIGGSTGAGKSTLLNSLVDVPVALASAIRPTTRRPLLLHHPKDAPWFTSDRVLGSLSRVIVDDVAPPTPSTPGPAAHQSLEVRATTRVPEGLALLDAPDIDSVVDENRELATNLLNSADLWLFVTTAARYADAVPWNLLKDAASRNTALAIVLNRVLHVDVSEVSADLMAKMRDAGLEVPLFTIEETALPGGRIPNEAVVPIRVWLGNLAMDANTRAAVARQTLEGAVEGAITTGKELAVAAGDQVRARAHMDNALQSVLQQALRRVSEATSDGAMLRGEVLTRWQDFVGTGEFIRAVESTIGNWRDSIGNFMRGKPTTAHQIEDAIETSLHALLMGEAKACVLDVEAAWQYAGGGASLVAAAHEEIPADHELSALIEERVRAWQGEILTMIRTEGASQRTKARFLSLGVNALGIALMVAIFAASGGLTGGEVAAAGGTAVVSQKVLESVFGEDAVRRMAKRSRQALELHARDVLAWYLRPYSAQLEGLELDLAIEPRVEAAIAHIRVAEALA